MSRARRAAGSLLGIALLGSVCYDTDQLTSPAQATALRLEPRTRMVAADGETAAWLLVHGTAGAPSSGRSVTLATDKGSFGSSGASTTLDLGRDGLDSARLVGRAQTGAANVRASIGGVDVWETIEFTRADPTEASVDAGGFTIAASNGATTNVRATLTRSVGTPTAGFIVRFSAETAAGDPLGDFRLTTPSDTLGVATTTYWVGETPYRGPVTISAHILSAFGTADTLVHASTAIQVVDPS